MGERHPNVDNEISKSLCLHFRIMLFFFILFEAIKPIFSYSNILVYKLTINHTHDNAFYLI